MRQRQRLRAADFSRIDRLIGQCRELGYDSDAWRSHLVAELDQLVGATVGTGLEIIGTGGTRMRMVRGVSRGWARPELRELWSRFVRDEDHSRTWFLRACFANCRSTVGS